MSCCKLKLLFWRLWCWCGRCRLLLPSAVRRFWTWLAANMAYRFRHFIHTFSHRISFHKSYQALCQNFGLFEQELYELWQNVSAPVILQWIMSESEKVYRNMGVVGVWSSEDSGPYICSLSPPPFPSVLGRCSSLRKDVFFVVAMARRCVPNYNSNPVTW